MANILLVDDSKIARMKLKQYLSELGHNIVGEAHDGIEGVKMYKQLQPDIVLSDLEMPNLDGYGLIEQIKGYNQKAKIIIITSVVNAQLIQKVINLGAVNTLKKPITVKTLQKVLDNVLKVDM